MIEDILVPIFFGSLVWIWGIWLQKSVHRRENDNAQFPAWMYLLLFRSKKKISRSGLLAKLFSILIFTYILVELNIVTIDSWKTAIYLSILPILFILMILVNWGRWF